MRYSYLFVIFLVIFIAVSGCTQIPPVPVTPTATPVTPLTPMPTLTPSSKQIDLTAWQTTSSVFLQYNGGRDAANLVALRVQIDNQDGSIIKRTLTDIAGGRVYEFPYQSTANARSINVIGGFRDGTEQTLMINYF
jgi:hypothetical protein